VFRVNKLALMMQGDLYSITEIGEAIKESTRFIFPDKDRAGAWLELFSP
jgi:hypothetical protein